MEVVEIVSACEGVNEGSSPQILSCASKSQCRPMEEGEEDAEEEEDDEGWLYL